MALDLTPAVVGFTGVARYAISFRRELDARSDITVRGFAAGRGRRLEGRITQLPIPLRAVHLSWRAFGRPRAEDIVGPVDVVHSVDLLPPPTRRPLVVTVHDVLAVTHPNYCSPRSRRIQLEQLERARSAALVVTTGESTADEIAAASGIPRTSIVATQLGADVSDVPAAGDARIQGLAVTVGELTPRKGFDILAAAADRCSRCSQVVFAGPDGWRSQDVRSSIGAAGRRGVSRLAGPVSDARLDELYRCAEVACFPSLVEGYSRPCLEAMARGCAIIASDLPPIREILGGAGLLVPPGDVDALAGALDQVLGDQEMRRDLAGRALARSREFTWKDATDRLAGAYRRALR